MIFTRSCFMLSRKRKVTVPKSGFGEPSSFVSWIVSISNDPLFCYVAVINDEKKFLEINIRLLIFLLVIFVVLHAYNILLVY